MNIKFLDLKKQYRTLNIEIDRSIHDVINDSAFIGSKYVKEFENNFALYHNANYCIGVGNGTDALEIAIWSLDFAKESEIIVPANSFIATSEAVTRNNLKVVFVDCKEDFTICPKSIEAHITDKTKAIIPVHLYGQPCDMDIIMEIAKKYNLKVIEDSAQAHGAIYKGRKIGTFGDLATFSFYPGKNLGAYGDGGAILTNDKTLEERCRMYANHGRSSKFAHEIEGINSRLDGLQAAILNIKLKHLDDWIEKRNSIAEYYLDNLGGLPIKLPVVSSDVLHVWHLFVIQTEDRDKLKEYLTNKNIQTGIHYPVALPKLNAYKNLAQDCSSFKAMKDDTCLLSLPIGEHLEQYELDYIVEEIKNFYNLSPKL